MKPHFLNPDKGYDIVKNYPLSIKAGKTIYDFRLNNPPLIYVDSEGRYWKPNDNFATDQGSVPWIAQCVVEKDRLIIFYFHDDGYRCHSLLASENMGKTWRRVPLPREQVDQLLYDGALVDPEPMRPALARCVWGVVRIGAGWAWNKHAEPPDWPIDATGVLTI